MKVGGHLHLIPKLRLCGPVHLLTLYNFMTGTGDEFVRCVLLSSPKRCIQIRTWNSNVEKYFSPAYEVYNCLRARQQELCEWRHNSTYLASVLLLGTGQFCAQIILLVRNNEFSIDRLFACAPDLVRNYNRQTDRQNTNNLYTTLNYISLSDICLTVHHWYK